METQEQVILAHPQGEQPVIEARSAIADTFAGRVHVEWDGTAPSHRSGSCRSSSTTSNRPGETCPRFHAAKPDEMARRRVFDAWVAGHRRYAHITALRCD